MRNFFISIFCFAVSISSYSQVTTETGLGETFIRSIKDNKFDLLTRFFPTVEFYKSIQGGNKKTEAEIKKILQQSNDRLKQNWLKIASSVKSRNYNMDKVEFAEQIIFNPFDKKSEMEAMVVVYKHEGKTWDDLSFIVSRWKGKIFLLEIPNPTKAFTFYDETLKESKTAKAALEIAKPGFKKILEEKVKSIIALVNENKLSEFAQNLVYRGEDENRKWKTQLNVNDSTEKQQAKEFMKRVERSIENCSGYKTGDVKTEKESEGTWIILPLICGNKTVLFAFLRIGENYLLGDINSEMR